MLAPSRRRCETGHLSSIRVARLFHGFSYTLWNIRTYLISNSRFTNERRVRFSIPFCRPFLILLLLPILPFHFVRRLIVVDVIIDTIFSLLYLFWKNESMLCTYFEKTKVCCLCVNPPYKLLNAWTNLYETWYVCHGTWAHLSGVLHKSLPSVCVSLCVSVLLLLGKGSVKCIPPFVARQLLGKHVPAAKSTRNNNRIVGHVCLCTTLLLVSNSSVKMLLRQRRSVGVIFYAIRVVSKEIISKLAQLWSIWLTFGS
jgi:hypothetical protein